MAPTTRATLSDPAGRDAAQPEVAAPCDGLPPAESKPEAEDFFRHRVSMSVPERSRQNWGDPTMPIPSFGADRLRLLSWRKECRVRRCRRVKGCRRIRKPCRRCGPYWRQSGKRKSQRRRSSSSGGIYGGAPADWRDSCAPETVPPDCAAASGRNRHPRPGRGLPTSRLPSVLRQYPSGPRANLRYSSRRMDCRGGATPGAGSSGTDAAGTGGTRPECRRGTGAEGSRAARPLGSVLGSDRWVRPCAAGCAAGAPVRWWTSCGTLDTCGASAPEAWLGARPCASTSNPDWYPLN